MDVILPVAGFGTRLRPQTWSKPKPLVGLAGKPMLAHVLDRLMPLEPQRLIFITGFLGEQIESWVKENYDIPSEFVEQPEMKGQTDAIIRTRHLESQDAIILFPDMLFEADFSVIDRSDADVIMFTKEVDDPSAYGIAVTEGDRIVKLVEKPQDPISRLAVIGIYYIRNMPDLFDAIDEQMERGIALKNEYYIADAIQLMIDSGKKVIPAPVTAWEDCGNDEALLSTNRYLLDRIDTTMSGVSDRNDSGAVIVQPSIVDSSATIEASVIGPYASVGPGATIRGSIVRDSIVEDGAVIETSILEHSVIGRKARVTGAASRLNVGDNSAVAV
jgi:glucose-1-phosphate thymidylyltransferase